MQTGRMLIDGAWVGASGGAEYAVPNPATEETLDEVPRAGASDVDRAVQAATRAFESRMAVSTM